MESTGPGRIPQDTTNLPDQAYQDMIRMLRERLLRMDAGQAQLAEEFAGTFPGLAQRRPAMQAPENVSFAAGSKDWKPPQWDGKQKSFLDYVTRLCLSYRARSALLPPLSVDLYWNAIYNSLTTEDKRFRLRHYYVNGAESADKDPGAFITHIESVFGDNDEGRKALSKLTRMRHEQGQLWREHQREFDALLLTAGGELWPENVKISTFEGTFSDNDQMRLLGLFQEYGNYHLFSRDVESVMTKFERTDEYRRQNRKWQQREKESGTYRPGDGSSTTKASSSVDTEGDTVMTATRSESFGRQNKNDGGRRPAAGDGKKRAKWVEKEEFERRREKGLCFRCGSSAHRANACPHLPPRKPVAMNAVVTESTTDVESEESDSERKRLGKA